MNGLSPEFMEMRQAIEALNAEFAWLIDHKDGAGVEELFTPEGVYDMSNAVYRGRPEIKSFYDVRKGRGRRTARHVFTNLRLDSPQGNRVDGTTILTLYAYDGEPPFPAEAILVADYLDIYFRDAGGRWLYEARTILPVFGGVPALGRRSGR